MVGDFKRSSRALGRDSRTGRSAGFVARVAEIPRRGQFNGRKLTGSRPSARIGQGQTLPETGPGKDGETPRACTALAFVAP